MLGQKYYNDFLYEMNLVKSIFVVIGQLFSQKWILSMKQL